MTTSSTEQFSAVREFEEWNAVTGALPEHTSWNYECRSILEDADKEIERLRAALNGIKSCSTCEVCRGAAILALGAAQPPRGTHTCTKRGFNAMTDYCDACFSERLVHGRPSQPPRDGQ